jgi:tetratricopeptide (TPR) repeat protein
MKYIGDAFLKKNEYNKAIQCFEKSGEDGLEGLGDCYSAKGNKQLAASYYRKCLNLDYYDGKNRVEKKLKELSY